MIRSYTIAALFICLAQTCWVQAQEKSLGDALSNVESLVLTYSQYAGDGKIGYWDINFSGPEVESIRPFLDLAKRPSKGVSLVLHKYEGKLSTENGNYRILVCEEKAAHRPFRFVLNQGEQQYNWVLVPPHSVEFGRIFDAAVKKKIDRPPDRTRKIE